MGLTSAIDRALARLASTRLHVLVVETPNSFPLRVAVEQACGGRGWTVASSPADADALVICGTAPPGPSADAVETLWSSLPGPRTRGQVTDTDAIPSLLDGLAHDYRAWDAGADRGMQPSSDHDMGGHDDHDSGGHDDHDSGGHDDDSGGHDDDSGGHDDDMGGMEMDMSGPGGLALASGADDRDGLEMDVLHLPLGLGLTGWPAGLLATLTLQGDVITEVDVRHSEPASCHDALAYRLDAAAQLLSLTGADVLAARVGRARDVRLGLVPDGPDPAVLRTTVVRSRVLRWSLRRVGPIDTPGEHGWPAAWAGDAYDRLLRMLTPTTGDDSGFDAVGDDLAGALPRLLVGAELATARLTVASLVGLTGARIRTGRDEVTR